jgi:hypothetical protein
MRARLPHPRRAGKRGKAPLIVWQLGEDLHALAAVFTATASGTHISGAQRACGASGKARWSARCAA